MNDAGTLSRHMLDVRELTPEAFAPYGQVIAPLRTGGQGAETRYDPEASASEAKLLLGNGEPRLWIMHLPHVGLGFSRIARHRRVTQCLGSLGGKEWLIGVAPPGTLATTRRLASRTSSPSGCRVIASSNCTSRPGMPGRILCMTNACSSIWRTSTPTGAISTPPHCRSNAVTGSDPLGMAGLFFAL